MVDIRPEPRVQEQTEMMNRILDGYLNGLKNCIEEISRQDIAGIAETIYQAYLKKKQLFILGNGGSAATASHMVCDLKKGAAVPGKPRLKVLCLSDNVPILSAIGNDIKYGDVFVEQLYSQVEAGDIVIGISCSGNSPNVLKAIEYSKQCGATIIAFTAFGGGKLRELADKCINLSTKSYGQGEDIALSLNHILAEMIRAKVAHED